MERIHLDVDSATGELPQQEAEIRGHTYAEVGEEEREIAYARTVLYEQDMSIYVVYIETIPEWRRKGVAERLLLKIVDELQVKHVRASTVSAAADAFFEHLSDLRPDLTFVVD